MTIKRLKHYEAYNSGLKCPYVENCEFKYGTVCAGEHENILNCMHPMQFD